jgi:hypothetical protein
VCSDSEDELLDARMEMLGDVRGSDAEATPIMEHPQAKNSIIIVVEDCP